MPTSHNVSKVSPSLRRVDGEEVWKISGAGLSEPVINSPLARLVGRVKIAEVEAPPKKKPCEALAPRDVWLFSLSLIVFIYMNIKTLYLFLLSSIPIFLILLLNVFLYSCFKSFIVRSDIKQAKL